MNKYKLFIPVLAIIFFILLFIKISFEGSTFTEGFVDGLVYSLAIILVSSLVVMAKKSYRQSM